MRRIILIVLKQLLFVPGYFYNLKKLIKKGSPVEEGFAYMQKFIRRIIRSARVDVLTYGEDNVPKEDGFILFPNHQGLFDAVALLGTSPRPLSFVYKKELENVILLKEVFGVVRAIPMDRKDIKQSLGVINQMAEGVRNGQNFVIFPEGTRSKNGNALLPFKGGSFKAATLAKCPIVPCAMIDCFKPFDDGTTKPVTCKLIYLEPIYYDEYCNMKTPEIATMVMKRIEEAIEKYK